MLANLNLPIIIAVLIAGIIGFAVFMINGRKIKHDNHLDELNDYDRQRALNDATDVGDGSYYGK